MTTKRFLTLAGAVAALAAGPAHAQHDHGMQHAGGQHGAPAASHAIAEGTVKDGVRTVEVSVTDDGFVPARIKAKKGEKLRLVVTRKTKSTCATEIVIKEHGINQPLPLGQPVTVELTPARSGELRYACAMNHVAGIVFVP